MMQFAQLIYLDEASRQDTVWLTAMMRRTVEALRYRLADPPNLTVEALADPLMCRIAVDVDR